MDEMQRPIGVFDSGVGGISVLRELVALMPNENFIFYGDSKNAPYGTKTLEEVRKLTLADAEYLKENSRVLVMATPMTLREKKFHNLMQKFQDQAEIISLPCPGLVEFVERGELSGEALEHFLKNLFAPYQERKVDAVVLGCTHYPLVRETIQKVLGQGVAVFDGGAGTARETLHKLKEYDMVSDAVTPGTVQFYNSAEDQKMIGLSKYLLEQRQM